MKLLKYTFMFILTTSLLVLTSGCGKKSNRGATRVTTTTANTGLIDQNGFFLNNCNTAVGATCHLGVGQCEAQGLITDLQTGQCLPNHLLGGTLGTGAGYGQCEAYGLTTDPYTGTCIDPLLLGGGNGYCDPFMGCF